MRQGNVACQNHNKSKTILKKNVMGENKQFIREETIRFLNKNVKIFMHELDSILVRNKETLLQIRAISELNMPNMISRLKTFADGLARNLLENFKDSAEINRGFVKQYERLDILEMELKSHQIACENFRNIRITFEMIDVATRELMIQNSEVPPLF